MRNIPTPTINEGIEAIVESYINQQPKPQKVTITKVYTGNTHIDCKNNNGDLITYVPCIATNPAVNNTGILLFLEDNEKIVTTK